MPQPKAKAPRGRAAAGPRKSKPNRRSTSEPRFSVALPSTVATDVERYAETIDASVSKAIATLVRLGLESQASRKQEFFERLKQNLARDDPKEQDRMVDEFRTLILGR